ISCAQVAEKPLNRRETQRVFSATCYFAIAGDRAARSRSGAGASRGSAPSQYRPFAMMQKPVAANQNIATPAKPVHASHHGLLTIDNADAMETLIPTAR